MKLKFYYWLLNLDLNRYIVKECLGVKFGPHCNICLPVNPVCDLVLLIGKVFVKLFHRVVNCPGIFSDLLCGHCVENLSMALDCKCLYWISSEHFFSCSQKFCPFWKV